MKAIITGMNGAVAPFIDWELEKRGIEAGIWDRTKVPTDNEKDVFHFIQEHKPDYFLQIATGPVEWLEYIAKATKELGVKLVFTSTVSVFPEQGTGPYTIKSVPNSVEDYGLYKIECEKTVRVFHPGAVILRIGWQIGTSAGSNNMIDFLERTFREKGLIEASTEWYPSTSFLTETAKVIVDGAAILKPDPYLVNSNKKYSFYVIAQHLKEKHKAEWIVQKSTDLKRDDRMFDDRINISELF
ncbi:sugar nucleotide-binding protein [Metabacillus sp. 84]|uniref:sugar nucleotide-binding protein n=1 Tax=Metabacillus sp. 84 TaxID=3404705 RepID=UPI003CED4011